MSAVRLQEAWRDRREWLFEEALPLWAQAGVDPAGGFHDRLDDARRPIPGPKRLRVQGRQVFVYAEAGRIGWTGPWRDLVEHGLKFLMDNAPLDGGPLPSLYEHGKARGLALYDQAFVLLALAHGRRALDEPKLEVRALGFLEMLRQRLGRPGGGFNELSPAEAPLQANPHMHLFEAMLAWRALSDAPVWAQTADVIRGLALDTFIDPPTGRLREFFDDQGRPDPNQISDIEPGHQFEWGTLLLLDGRGGEAAAERMIRDTTAIGVDRGLEAGINAQKLDGTAIDATARLWVQTERMRAALLMARRADDPAFWLDEALRAETTLRRYLDDPGGGLWRDLITEDGALVEEPSKASSLYHILGAYLALKDAAEA